MKVSPLLGPSVLWMVPLPTCLSLLPFSLAEESDPDGPCRGRPHKDLSRALFEGLQLQVSHLGLCSISSLFPCVVPSWGWKCSLGSRVRNIVIRCVGTCVTARLAEALPSTRSCPVSTRRETDAAVRPLRVD